MATTLTPRMGASRATDLSQNTKYNVHLGKGLKDIHKHEFTFSSVAFNHKSSQTSAKRSTIIKRSNDDSNICSLSVIDEDNGHVKKTKYHGRRRTDIDSYILLLSEDQQILSLEPLGNQYKFNMVSAPWEDDGTKIQQEYKQIDMDEEMTGMMEESMSEKEEDLFGINPGEPDPENPFDYRHYLNMQPTGVSDSRNPSNAGTPVISAINKVFPTPRPQIRSPVPQANVAPRPLRAKPRRQPSPVFMMRDRSKSPQVPLISSSPESLRSREESLGFELGAEARVPKGRAKAAGIASNGHPVSLRAAAASPQLLSIPQVSSPIPQDVGSGYEEEDDSADADGEEQDGEADDDVDELELPGPVVGSGEHHDMPRRHSTWDEETADVFTANLAAMLAAEDDEADEEAVEPGLDARKVVVRKMEDSDSESEEE